MKTIAFVLIVFMNVARAQENTGQILISERTEKMDSASIKLKEYKYYESEGRRYLEEGDLYKAFNFFIRGISLNNNSAPCYYGLGRVLYEMDEYQVAMADFQKALQFNQDKQFERELLYRIDACKKKIE
jgi:tetratricopeptide (TPR) repeat protein